MDTVLLKHLSEASRNGDINELQLLMANEPSLLDRFVDDAPEGEEHDNPLHIAASCGHVDFTIELLQLKPQLAQMRNRQGRLPLHFAAASGHLQVMEKLINQQHDKTLYLSPDSKYGYMPAHMAAINGEYTTMKMLIEKCRDVLDKTTRAKETLMHLAVIANCLDSVRYLINLGVNPNEEDVDRNTCLHLACQNRNHHDVITYLLDHKDVEVNSTNASGLTPLDIILMSSSDSATDASLVRLLRRAGGEGAIQRDGRLFFGI
ncbi:hypothetical protein LUZ62_071424 [Rhynchospora pubera]|uniref:Uncharacterized protein n=1 Tax=Rhynchospora pubera TaxID=906938 RepID=A0AAV8D228_9POAL|nr:hypothetical protein LUZ62_071424 [Rhynchospora pubera]